MRGPRITLKVVVPALTLLALIGCSSSPDATGPVIASAPSVSATAPTSAPTSASAIRKRNDAEQSTTSTRSPSLRGFTVAIDPGHNGGNGAHPAQISRLVDAVTLRKPCDTTGTATKSGYAESAFTYDVSRRLKRELEKSGAEVVMTRTGNNGVGPCITERADVGNRAKADAAISIHADGGPSSGYGFHVIRPKAVGPNDRIIRPSERLAFDVRRAFAKGTGEPYATYVGSDAIDARSDLGGLNLSTVPKVFIECGNMRNAADARKLTDPNYRERAARALAVGLASFLLAEGERSGS